MEETRKYKQTELGLIPADWIEGKFEDFLNTFSSGATPYRGNSDFFKGEILWISSGELNYNWITSTKEHISVEALNKTNLKLHEPGTFLMAITGLEAEGTRGRCAFVGIPAATNQSCLAINSSEKMGTDYLFYFYIYWSKTFATKYSQGTKQQSYTALLVRSFPIYSPNNITEQRRIASALTSIDNLIDSLDRLIAKKRDIKQGAMQQLLSGKKRLKGFTEPWVEKKLGEFEFRSGQMLKSSEYKSGNIPVIAGGKNAAGYHNKPNRPSNTITISGSGASAGFVAFHKNPIFASDCSTINEQQSVDIMYLFFCLVFIQEDIFKCQTGGAQPHIHPKDIKDLVILLPTSLSEQQAIAAVLTSMDNELSALEAKRKKYEQIKQGMMQQLLTGRIRLAQ